MESKAKKITLINIKTKRRRVIHLITKAKKKSHKYASANAKQWAEKHGYPILAKVSYGIENTVTGRHEVTNSKDCEDLQELDYCLISFVKEYTEEIID